MARTVDALMLRILVIAGTLVGVWVALAVFAADASAEDKPQPPPVHPHDETHSSGLVACLLGATLDIARPLVGGVVHTVADAPAVEEPVALPILEIGSSSHSEVYSAPAAVSVKPVAAPRTPVAVAPEPVKAVAGPVAPRPAKHTPAPPPAAPAAKPEPPAPIPTFDLAIGSSDEQADHRKIPDQPAAPSAPAAPGSTASSASDGGGQARGLTGMLAGREPLTPPASAGVAGTRVTDAQGRDAGLPASSPD